MKHFRVGAAATGTRVDPGIILLIFGLIGRAIHNDIIYLYITIATIVGEGHTKFTGTANVNSVVLHVSTQRPSLNGCAAHL